MSRHQEIVAAEQFGGRITGRKPDAVWRLGHWQKLERLRDIVRRRCDLLRELERDYAAMPRSLAAELRAEAARRLEDLELDLRREASEP